jgi:hypothetical protein
LKFCHAFTIAPCTVSSREKCEKMCQAKKYNSSDDLDLARQLLHPPPSPPGGGGGGLYHAPWGPSSRIKIYLCLCKSRLAQFLSPSPKGQRKISENKSKIRLKDSAACSTLSLSVNNNKLQKEKILWQLI